MMVDIILLLKSSRRRIVKVCSNRLEAVRVTIVVGSGSKTESKKDVGFEFKKYNFL